jgi:microcystin-dependent protein
MNLTSINNQLLVSESINTNRMDITNDIYLNSVSYTPVGSILIYAGSSAPTGWLLCNGQEVSRTVYPRLFAVIGNSYGSLNNNNNFVLPDLSDRVPVGKSGSNNLGDSSGNSKINLSTSQLPSHTHSGTIDSSGSHIHTGTTDISGSHNHTGTTDISGSHIHGITDPGHRHTQNSINDDFNNSGGLNYPGSGSNNLTIPSFAQYDSSGSITWNNINNAVTNISLNSAGNHTHGVTTQNAGDHAHTLTIEPVQSHSHSFTINSTGNGADIDIRNKFIILNYIIRY